MLKPNERGGLNLLASASDSGWAAGLRARHRFNSRLAADTTVQAAARWGQTAEWKATAGLKWRW